MVEVIYTQYASWLKDITKNLQHPIARDSEQMIVYLRVLENNLPKEYQWHMMDEDGLQRKIQSLQNLTAEAINQVYWEDMARNIESWSIMAIWRSLEILNSGIVTLNSRQFLSSSILGRSLLELACVMLTEANNIFATINSIQKPTKDHIVTSEELEKIIVRLIWGTRYSEQDDQGDIPDHLKQKNIISYLQRLSKNPNASDLFKNYEYLCEVAHPNVIGYARFIGNECVNEEYDQIVHISSEIPITESQAGNKLVEKNLWAFGWSSVALRNGFHIVQESIELIDKHFNIRKKARSFEIPKGKIGRNEPCPCGSGKKFKHCHGK